MFSAFRRAYSANAGSSVQKSRTSFRLMPIAILFLALMYPLFAPFMAAAETAAPEPIGFSVQRGFYDSPFALTLASSLSGGAIRYTLNGATPTPTSGTVYGGPINIATTTVVRAIAYTSTTTKTRVVTHTYIFLNSVRSQSDTARPGWPSTFAAADDHGSYPSDYEVDPEVVNHPNNSAKFNDVMLSVPSLSIVTDLPNLWDPNYGIYYNSNAKEDDPADPFNNPVSPGKWERPVSMEWINPDGTTGFAEYGGMRVHGQSSRRPHRQPKKSFRIYFKAAYGTPKLDFKLFDYGDAVTKFDRIVVRGGGNRTWPYFDRDQRKDADYVNDEWARRAWMQMGNLSPHGTYVHLYLNGLYWGLYNVIERIDGRFVSSYLGGSEADYDVIDADEDLPGTPPAADSGDTKAWYDLLDSVAGTAPITNAQYQSIQTKVDVVNLADYFVHVHYIGKTDWGYHNWNTYRQRSGTDTRFKFIPWDNDTGLNDINTNNTLTQDLDGEQDAPVYVFLRLTTNPEFRQMLADRLWKHVVDLNGMLTPVSCDALYKQVTAIVDQAVIGESARWGDYMRDKYPRSNDAPKGFPAYLHSRDLPNSFTDPSNAVTDNVQFTWMDVRDEKLANYCPKRSNVVVSQYVTNGWYQNTVHPPVFSQRGGAVTANYKLTMSNSVNGSAGDIYYTTSGTDPRAAFGAVASGATPGADEVNINISQVTTVKARVLNNGTWSPMAEYTFYPPQPFENLVINEIHYNPIPPVGMSPSDYEFVELYNKGTTPLRLDNVSFSRGISYRFPVNTRLEPGKYIVLVSEPAAFKTRYNLTASGSYRGNLSNDGEAIEIIDAVGNVIDFVDYKVAAPWPTAPNGGGTSLSLARNDLDNSQAWVWGASLSNGGTPNAANGDIPVASPPPTPIQKRIFLPSVGR